MCKQCSSYRKQAGDWKDERRNSNLAPDEMPHKKKSAGSKANKFCRKKIGQEHVYSVRVYKYQTQTWRAFVMACERCGKQDFSTYTSQRKHTSTIWVGPDRIPEEHTYWV